MATSSMTNAEQKINQIQFRSAKPSDAKLAAGLLFDTFPKLATHVFGLGDETKAKAILEDIFSINNHRFSYDHAQMMLQDGQVIGMMISFSGRELPKLNRKLAGVLIRQYKVNELPMLIRRGMALLFINEAAFDEYLLSNLAVNQGDRGSGIGTHSLTQFEKKAIKNGFKKVSLMVEQENSDAQRFYERNGYHVAAKHLVAEKHQHALGHGYLRMIKELHR